MPPVFGVLFDGLAYGMLLFLLSVGLSVTLGMMNFVNLAHCSFAMLGGYVTVTLINAALAPAAAAHVEAERDIAEFVQHPGRLPHTLGVAVGAEAMQHDEGGTPFP